MNKWLYSLIVLSTVITVASNTSAADRYIGGVPVEDYYGQPVPDMFEIAGRGFDAAIADIKNGVKDWADDFEFKRGKKPPLPPGLPKAAKDFAKRANFWIRFGDLLNFFSGDQLKPDYQREFADSAQEIPTEIGSEEGFNRREPDFEHWRGEPDYIGDFGADFGRDFSGES